MMVTKNQTTVQVDELREAAVICDLAKEHETAKLLREAAYTIESLRDRLQAATLGGIEEPDTIRNELTDSGFIDTRATHGTLTAEQVREIVEKHWHDLPDEYDMPEATALPEYSYDWQAIADDLNAGFENDDDYERKMDTLLCRLTNGKWSKSRAYSIEFMDACISEEFEALYSEEQFSAPVHGTLTVEQVREAVEASTWAETSTIREFNDSSWQAIADELNAELGSGTCEVECFDDGVDEGMDGEWFSYAPPTWYLSCGHTAQGTERPNFCPNCGAKVMNNE